LYIIILVILESENPKIKCVSEKQYIFNWLNEEFLLYTSCRYTKIVGIFITAQWNCREKKIYKLRNTNKYDKLTDIKSIRSDKYSAYITYVNRTIACYVYIQ